MEVGGLRPRPVPHSPAFCSLCPGVGGTPGPGLLRRDHRSPMERFSTAPSPKARGDGGSSHPPPPPPGTRSRDSGPPPCPTPRSALPQRPPPMGFAPLSAQRRAAKGPPARWAAGRGRFHHRGGTEQTRPGSALLERLRQHPSVLRTNKTAGAAADAARNTERSAQPRGCRHRRVPTPSPQRRQRLTAAQRLQDGATEGTNPPTVPPIEAADGATTRS